MRVGRLVLLLPLLAASCAGLERQDQGLLQPQSVSGPCQVKKFYILNNTAVHTTMTVSGAGGACRFTVFNPDQQIITTAMLVTEPPAHGQAEAGGAFAGRQAVGTYTPQPGYAGPDHFTITLEPLDRAISVAVSVQPAG